MHPVLIANYEHLGVILWGEKTMRELLAVERERLEKYPRFALGWDNEAFSYDYLAQHHPGLLKEMRTLYERFPGRVGLGTSTYGQPLSLYISGESNVRQLTYAVEAVQRHFGARPYLYVMSEHAFHAQMPQLLHSAGFTGAIMRTHFMMYGVCPQTDASLVNWLGLDAKRGVPTVPTYVGQASFCPINGFTVDPFTLQNLPFGFNTLDNKILTDAPDDCDVTLDDFRAQFGPRIKHLLASRADDPRQREGIAAIYSPRDDMKFVVDRDVIAALGPIERDWQPAPDEFVGRMPWGLCGNWIWQASRRVENALLSAQALDAVRTVKGAASSCKELEEAWKALLVSQHHDIWICALEKDANQYITEAEHHLQRALGEASEEISWFNPLPHARRDPRPIDGAPANAAGYGCAGPAPAPGAAIALDAHTLTTACYTVRLHPQGGFAEIFDRENQRQLFAPGSRNGYFAGVIDGRACVSVGDWSVDIQPYRAVLKEKGTIGGVAYENTWVFYAIDRRIDYQTRVDVNGQCIGRGSQDARDAMAAFIHEEKLRLKFYPNLDGPVAVRDLPYAVAQTERQTMECNLWLSLQDQRGGLAIFNRGLMAGVREQDGALSVPIAFSGKYIWCANVESDDATLLRIELGQERAEKHTGYSYLNKTVQSELAIYPYEGTWQSAQVHRRALEYNQPLLPAPQRTHGICVDLTDNAFVSALYCRNGSIYLRLYELYGHNARAQVSVHGRAVQLCEANLLEQQTGEAVGTACLAPHEVRTYRLEI